MIYSTFLAFGDSLTYGSRDENNLSYPIYLSNLIKEKYNQRLLFENAGIPGETTSDAIKRAYNLIRSSSCHEVLFLEGTNDAKDNIKTPVNIYKSNLEYIIDTCNIFNKKLYLATIPDLKGFGAPDYTAKSKTKINEYNKVIIDISKDKKIAIVDLRNLNINLYSDGVHLNSSGYKEVAIRVLRVIEKERLYN